MRELLTLLLLMPVALALDVPLVELVAQPAQVAVGDRVTVTITYRWPSGWHAREPEPTSAFLEAFVADSPPPVSARTGEEERRTWTLVVLATRSGPWALPRPRFEVTGPDGVVTAQAPEVLVQVGAEASPPAPAAARPLWVAGTDEVKPTRWWIAVLIALLLAALLGWWLLRRRRVIDVEPPGDRLRRELAELSGLRDGKEISARLTLALRRWCGAVFSYDGPGLTTRETLARLRGTLPDEELATLGRLLGELDGLRWAAENLDAGTVLPLSQRALAWSDGVMARLALEQASMEREG